MENASDPAVSSLATIAAQLLPGTNNHLVESELSGNLEYEAFQAHRIAIMDMDLFLGKLLEGKAQPRPRQWFRIPSKWFALIPRQGLVGLNYMSTYMLPGSGYA